MGYLFLILYVLLSGSQMLFNKVYQKHVPTTFFSYALFEIVIAVSAMTIYAFMNGFQMAGTPASYACSAVGGALCFINMLMPLICMRFTNLAVLTVASNAGTLIIPSLYGMIFLHEALTPLRFLGIVLIFSAFLVSFASDFRHEKNRASSVSPESVPAEESPATEPDSDGREVPSTRSRSILSGYAASILLFLTSGCMSIIHKLFTIHCPDVESPVYLFWTSITMILLSLLVILIVRLRSKDTIRSMISALPMKYYLVVLIGNLAGATSSLASVRSMSLLDISVYSPLSSALYMILLTFSSRLIFKEKLSLKNYLSVGLGIVAVIVSVL